MIFNMTTLRIFLIALASLLLSKAYAQGVGIISSPNKCVALHKGQTCYQRVKFSVKKSLDQEYCLMLESTKQLIKCWRPDEKDLFVYDFESAESIKFLLVDATERKVFDTFTVTVAWVYKQNKKSFSGWRWRVF